MSSVRSSNEAFLPDLSVLALMNDVERAIAIVKDSRLTHVHWAEWRRNGGTGDDMAGDLAHHEQAIRDYDLVLAVLARQQDGSALRSALERLADAVDRAPGDDWWVSGPGTKPWDDAHAVLAALPPSAPAALDTRQAYTLLCSTEPALIRGVESAPNATSRHYQQLLLDKVREWTTEYARLQEPER